MNALGGTTIEATLSGLNSATTYSIEVAAVNSAGTGDYSNSISATTSGTNNVPIPYILVVQNQYVLTITLYYSLIPVVVPPVVSVGSTTPTTIPFSWTSPGPVVDSYVVTWTSRECPNVDEGNTITITDGSTSYIISGLQEGSSYTINVTTTNTAGSAVSDSVTGRTQETSERLVQKVFTEI